MEFSIVFRLISSLAIVFALLALFFYYLRRSRPGLGQQGAGLVTVLEKAYLESNKSVVLIQVNDRMSLLALSGDRIEHLWTASADTTDSTSSERLQGR